MIIELFAIASSVWVEPNSIKVLEVSNVDKNICFVVVDDGSRDGYQRQVKATCRSIVKRLAELKTKEQK